MKKQLLARFIYSSNYGEWIRISWIDLEDPEWTDEKIQEELKRFEYEEGYRHAPTWSGFEYKICNRSKILLGITGSVATIVSNNLISKLDTIADLKVIFTDKSLHFYEGRHHKDVYFDEDEWRSWEKKGDPVLHIELRKWADVFVIAPLSANTLAKIANGICDNLLTCVARAWDWNKPLFVAPSMNTMMLEHPVTKEHIEKIKNWGVKVIPSQVKLLACGDIGDGAMASVKDIIKQIEELWK